MPAKKQQDITFEEALERLHVIADKLENGNPSLEEALTLYEESAGLLKNCDSKLQNAKARISLVTEEKDEA